MGKKAQVTLFMIIGIVLVMVFLFTFSISKKVSEVRVERDIERTYQQIIETTSLKKFVTRCADDAVRSALVLAGKTGGHVDGDTVEYLNPAIYEEPIEATFLEKRSVPTTPPKYPCYDESIAPAYCKFTHDQDNYQYYYGVSEVPALCKPGSNCELQGSDSLQYKLEEFMALEVEKCVQFDEIVGINSTYNITKGNVSVDIDIGEVAFTAVVNYPIVFHVIGHEPVEKITDFVSQEKARLYFLFRCASNLVKRDSMMLNFDPYNEFSKTPYCSIFTNYSIFESTGADVIGIFDDKFYLDGEPYFFHFAIENKYPVLDYISRNAMDDYDYVVFVNETFTIDPYAIDPDNDKLVYTYSGWRDFDLKSSLAYLQTKRKAELKLTEKDVGPHNITVRVDDGQLNDYQVVRVLVDDVLKFNASGHGIYEGFPDNITSIEDPYILEPDHLDEFILSNIVYTWKSDLNGILYEGNKGKVYLPNTDCDGQDCLSIDDVSGKFISVGVHNVSVEAFGVKDDMLVEVKQCMPYYSSVDPHPFGDAGFMSSHVCCALDYTLYNVNKVCFNQVEKRVGYDPLAVIEPADKVVGSVSKEFGVDLYNAQNDIIGKEINVSCDGVRGNICGGNAVEYWNTLIFCDDGADYETERCVYGGAFNEIHSGALVCKNVISGTTFEKLFGLLDKNEEAAEGICNKEWKCTDGVKYSESGDFKAQATCDGEGGCDLVKNVFDCNDYDKTNPAKPGNQIEYFDVGQISGAIDFNEIDPNVNLKTTRDYYCGNGDCKFEYVNLDSGYEWCNSYSGSSWLIEGEGGSFGEYTFGQTACCGDDLNEYERLFESSISSGSSDKVCCDAVDDCVLNEKCFASGTVKDIGGDVQKDYCTGGVWEDCQLSAHCPKLKCQVADCSGYDCEQENVDFGEFDVGYCENNLGCENGNCLCANGACVSAPALGSDNEQKLANACSKFGYFVKAFYDFEQNSDYNYGCCYQNSCWNGNSCTQESKPGYDCIGGSWIAVQVE
jgi:hypothetical protein